MVKGAASAAVMPQVAGGNRARGEQGGAVPEDCAIGYRWSILSAVGDGVCNNPPPPSMCDRCSDDSNSGLNDRLMLMKILLSFRQSRSESVISAALD